MARVTSTLLLLAGAVILVTWLVSPASSAPQAPPASRESSLDQILPVLADVNAQVDRLRERLVTVTMYPPPSRDPFNYRVRAPRQPAESAERLAPAVTEVPVAVAPQLVAILTTDGPAGTVTRTAVLTDRDDDVQVVAVGESVGSFAVSSIEEDVVVLNEKGSGRSVRLTLH